LERYSDFARYLARRYAVELVEEGTATVWNLGVASGLRSLDDLMSDLLARADQPAVLDWQTEHDVSALLTECSVFAPAENLSTLPYADHSVDVVALGGDVTAVGEARRVARDAVVTLDGPPEQPSADVIWRANADGQRATQVSIVVTCRQSSYPSDAFLRHIRETIPPSFDVEILVPVSGAAATPEPGKFEVVRCRDAVLGRRLRRAATVAKGEYIVVVDSEVWPVAGWLPPLIQPLRYHADSGAVTGLLVLPDGRVPLTRASQNGAVSVHGEDPGSMRHRYVRRVPAAANELFATDRHLFLEHARRWSKYDEPVPAFSACLASDGLAVLYQPETMAVRPWPEADPVLEADG
jgi:hypothetical protein